MLRLLDHIIGALYFLNHFEHDHSAVRPEHILLDEEGKYLLVDCKMLQLPTNYERAKSCHRSSQHRSCTYLSPKEMTALKTKELAPHHQPELSDVFAIGLVALEMATMEDLNGLHDCRNFLVDAVELKRLLDKVAHRYSQSFVKLLRSMLELEEDKRINFNLLIDQLSPILTAAL